jgi:hypothetical protein
VSLLGVAAAVGRSTRGATPAAGAFATGLTAFDAEAERFEQIQVVAVEK